MTFRLALCGLALAALTCTGFAASPVRINEFLAGNSSGLRDEDGDYSDWIELHNTGSEAVQLDEWFLTDNAAQPTKWEFPTTTVPPGGFLVVFASGKNRNVPALHANFSLSQNGEYLALFDREGQVITEFAPGFPAQQQDVSYGYDTAGNLTFFTAPTPGAPNTGAGTEFVADTRFSVDRGFFEEPFDLTISTATEGATIRYTTNGTPPTAETGLVYTGPIRITGTTVLRAAAFKAGAQPSNVDTHTYLFLDDIIRQSPNGAPPPGWPGSWGANVVDYGMDQRVVNDARYRDTIKDDLKSISTLSIVMRLPDLFDSRNGIYANPGNDGVQWERPCSLELIHPNGDEGFQIDAGIRIRGGFSRSTANPKHAFRLFFKQEYGAGKLDYPLFGDDGADEFDKVDLRTFQNYSWSFQGDANGVFLRDQFSRDTQLEMGHQAERGDFYHLYINGHYWGLYNTDERPEAAYAATYFGGNREDYDTVKVAADEGYTVYATDGNMGAWTALYNLARAGFSSNEAYQRVQGNNPDGTPNPNYPVFLDLPNLIDYMLVIIYTGNKDAPISNFLGNDSPNNWFGVRNRNIDARMGFKFFSHDAEHSLLPWDLNIDRTGPFPAGDTSVTKSSPQYLWKRLTANPEFRLLVADHIQRHFFNNGLLTPEANLERFLRRKAEIDRAVVAESARWGDAKTPQPLTRDNHWIPAINAVVNNFFPTRTQIVLNQLRADGLYPTVAAPQFNLPGGSVDPGSSLTITAQQGDIYYTTDGTDPRLTGGDVSGRAVRYTSPIILDENVVVKARALAGSNWSALSEANFAMIRTFKELMITELMYHPADAGGIDGDEFEFVEFKNIGSSTLDLSGIRFTNGIEFVFPAGTRLAPGEFFVLAGHPEHFAQRYPTVRIDGVFTNNLSNSGERLALVHAAGAPIAQFTYSDDPPWPITADGGGFSLVPKFQATDFDYNNPENWRASARIGGSPGADDPPIDTPAVIINEVLTHSDVDAIELHNPTDAPAEISGWFLTDNLDSPAKFRIPDGTIIPSGGYLVFTEADFNKTPGVPPSFSFSSSGEDAYLFSANLDGTLSGYSQGFSFGAAEEGVSFGRYTNSVGEILYPPQLSLTLEAANSGPRVGPIVINEIQYHPAPAQAEFIELKNISDSAVKLYDPAHLTNTWSINGIGFDFPMAQEIPPGGIVVISGIDTNLFRQQANLPDSIPIYGPFSGNLQDNGELIEILRPGTPVPEGAGVGFVPYIAVDAVRYASRAPWPTGSAGTGSSIERLVGTAFGNDPANWRSSPGPASPGLENDGNRLPILSAGADLELISAAFPVSADLSGEASDDGLPNPPNALSLHWTQVNGPGPVQFQNADSLSPTVSFPGVGLYTLRLAVSDGEFTVSDEVTVTITRPLDTTQFVPANSVWKYLDNGSNQGSAWRATDFTDTSWKSGTAPLGYGDPVTTTVGYGPNSGSKYPTTYFRREFTVNGARSVASLTARLRRDDGAIVYLNGTEIFRSNMPQGNVNYLTYAANVVGGGEETTFYEEPLDPTLLREGRNVLAVELHQANAGSSDLAFDLELVGLVSSSNQPPTADAGPDLNAQAGTSITLNGTATDDGLPNPPGVYNANWSIVSGPGSVTFGNANSLQSAATFDTGGVYTLRLSVTDGELTATDDLQVTVTGADPYAAWLASHFTAAELADPAISAENADPDGDRFTNRQEYIAGTDPRDDASFLHISDIERLEDDLVLRFDMVGDKSYTVEGRDRFGDGTWERLLDLSPQGTSRPMEILDPFDAGPGTRFYRIVTPQRPPQ